MRRPLGVAFVSLLAAFVLGGPAEAQTGQAAPAAERPLRFTDLRDWQADDHGAALAAFRRSCRSSKRAPDLLAACHAAVRRLPSRGAAARLFFETWFEPVEIVPAGGSGFLTGYFEPEYTGSTRASPRHPTPLLGPPTAAMPRPLPDRAAIEAGALGSAARPVVYLDPVDAFVTHVQGSARIRLADGGSMRVAFAGRNGHPYTPIARVLAEREGIPPAALGLEALTAWLRAHPADAPALMAQNRSYIFFRRADDLGPRDGPTGAAGVPLAAGRSLAVDARVWRYGLPVWLEAELPDPEGGTRPLRRLVVAQDTGAAIVGPARGDLFVGSGPQAGRQAGLLREPVRFVVLRPLRAPATP